MKHALHLLALGTALAVSATIAKADTIAAGSEFSDVQAYVDQEQQRIEQGAEPLGPPDFLSLVTREDVATGDSGTLSSELTGGTYALICQHDQPPTAISLVKPPLEVSG